MTKPEEAKLKELDKKWKVILYNDLLLQIGETDEWAGLKRLRKATNCDEGGENKYLQWI